MTMSKPDAILGIDNGINGGLALLSAHSGEVIFLSSMPTTTVGQKEEPSVLGVLDLLSQINRKHLVVAIEEPLRHAKSSQAMRSMALGFGKLVGLFECKSIPVVRIAVKDWQKKMLGIVPAKKTKEFALRMAKDLWPDETWLANSRCRTPHDGIVDAALIAEFYRRTL